jgi:hypothetical protein
METAKKNGKNNLEAPPADLEVPGVIEKPMGH